MKWLGAAGRRLTAVAIAGAVAALAGSAAAKGPDRARVCGLGPCLQITGDRRIAPLLTTWWSEPFSAVATPRPTPYFTLAIAGNEGGGRWLLVWAPAAGLLRVTQIRVPPYQTSVVGPYWRPVSAAACRAFAAATQGLLPHPAGRWACVGP